ncbi:hypothetical protein [Crocosphaera chwakensis]|uniref:Uncharacterized protein n=1 Tax=Crocosphaera chwakensis CCY0110 TaxID=391612 RepID=A3IZ61_9CHRO|nr:hypothetical protein [Crocosphaera chwakensis]EAZ88231.1 hypothetical protein CY0110_01245 [Crocosphaera chwakensis CCY0110]
MEYLGKIGTEPNKKYGVKDGEQTLYFRSEKSAMSFIKKRTYLRQTHYNILSLLVNRVWVKNFLFVYKKGAFEDFEQCVEHGTGTKEGFIKITSEGKSYYEFLKNHKSN